jgi:hypothetical protein
MDASEGEHPKGLETKWWYRLLRVILIPLYGLVLLWAFLLIYEDNHPSNAADEEKSLIVCDDGKSYRLSAIGYVSALELGEQLTGSDADAARNLCSYGQTSAPSVGLGTVKMPDGVLIEGVPTDERAPVDQDALAQKHGVIEIDPKTGEVIESARPDLMARYQRWRDSYAKEFPPGVIPEWRLTRPFQALHRYTVNMAFRTEGSWVKMFSYMAIAWLVIHLTLVMVRGAVLYVAVGRFLPVRGLRGWLIL